MALVDEVYAAAGNAGLLKSCVWLREGYPPEIQGVHFRTADENLLDGLTVGTELSMTYPASYFMGMGQDETVEIDAVRYVVREVRAIHDGTELKATLATA